VRAPPLLISIRHHPPTVLIRIPPDRIRTVTLGSNFTVRIFCQVSFYQYKISSLELVFRVVDLDFRAVD